MNSDWTGNGAWFKGRTDIRQLGDMLASYVL
jgi:hypothetical protein